MNHKVLIADDNKYNIRLLTDILQDAGYTVYTADNGVPVLEMTHSLKPDAVLLDIMMPGLNGFQVCELLKKDTETRDIPVIMITAKTDGNDINCAFELGAFDYIKKPIDEIEVLARLKSALRYKEQQDKLKDMAMKDGLTGVYNHVLLLELFQKELIKQQRHKGNMAFVMVDIDYFKRVNDTYGHTSGDIILKELAGIISVSVRGSDIVGRYGGEEFSIILSEVEFDEVLKLCERIRSDIENYVFRLSDETIHITVSMGVYFKTPEDKTISEDIIKKADEALYHAKRSGRNRVEISNIK